MKLCIAVMLTGVVVALGCAVALATGGDARGGQAVTVTTKAPHHPKVARGWIGGHVGPNSQTGFAKP